MTYVILLLAKKEIVSEWYTNEPPIVVAIGGSTRFERLSIRRLIAAVISIQPFANIAADYTCHNRDQERNYQFQAVHPLSVARLGATTRIL
jgi:hypothetical protein